MSKALWSSWFVSWFAAFWQPEDVGSIGLVIQLYDQTQRGHLERAAEYRMASDTWGISPKGQQDRRWLKPKVEPVAEKPAPAKPNEYGKLKVVGE